MNITLKAEEEEFIKLQLKSGKYETAEQVISEALKLLKEQPTQEDKKRLEELRQKIAVGMEQIAQGQLMDGEVVFDRLQSKQKK